MRTALELVVLGAAVVATGCGGATTGQCSDCSGSDTPMTVAPSDGGEASASAPGPAGTGGAPADATTPAEDSGDDATTPSGCASCDAARSASDCGAGATDASKAPVGPDAAPATADAFVSVSVGAGVISGVNDVGACGMSSPDQFEIGNAVQPVPTTMSDGSSELGSQVTVNCTVVPTCAGFDIQLAATLQGQYGGALFVSGSVSAQGTGSGLRGSITTGGQTFLDQDCTIYSEYNGGPLPLGGAPAAGRIWGHITCPNAIVNGQFGTGLDGGAVTRACEAQADFLFENCRQG